MKVAVFTGTEPRHLALVKAVNQVSDEVVVVHETKTLFPGKVQGVHSVSDRMSRYFERVNQAEKQIFGKALFGPRNISQLILQRGDIHHLKVEDLEPVWDCDVVIVFSGSLIKPPILDRLVERRAINLHMGVSPYYRGMSCNFWALFDNRPELVGATVHRLSAKLDAGDILFHALPFPEPVDGFLLGMLAVRAAIEGCVSSLGKGTLLETSTTLQNRLDEIRRAKGADFQAEGNRWHTALYI